MHVLVVVEVNLHANYISSVHSINIALKLIKP